MAIKQITPLTQRGSEEDKRRELKSDGVADTQIHPTRRRLPVKEHGLGEHTNWKWLKY